MFSSVLRQVQCCFTAGSVLLYDRFSVALRQVQCCFTSTETIRTIRDIGGLGGGGGGGGPGRPPRLSRSSGALNVHNDDVGLHVLGCRVDILGTKNVNRDRTDYQRDGKPRTSISTFTQLLSFDHPSSSIALIGYAIGRCPLTDSFCFLLVF